MDIHKQLERYTRYAQGDLSQACSLHVEDAIFQAMDFSKYDLNNSEFLEAQFLKCNFEKVYLSGTSFCGSIIQGGIFKENILRKANWDYISIRDTEISRLDAFRTSFYDGNFQKVVFDNCRLEKCTFTNSVFDDVQFVDCNLSWTSFHNARFKKVQFCHCIFNQTSFAGLSLNADVSFEEITLVSNGEMLVGLGNDVKSFLIKQQI